MARPCLTRSLAWDCSTWVGVHSSLPPSLPPSLPASSAVCLRRGIVVQQEAMPWIAVCGYLSTFPVSAVVPSLPPPHFGGCYLPYPFLSFSLCLDDGAILSPSLPPSLPPLPLTVSEGALPHLTPSAVASFLRTAPNLMPEAIGCYLGKSIK